MKPLQRLQKCNTKDNLWIYILSLLKKSKAYAWELQSLIEKKFGFKPGRITSYRVLYRLEADDFVKSQTRGRRRIYQITKRGEKELEKAKTFYKGLLSTLR